MTMKYIIEEGITSNYDLSLSYTDVYETDTKLNWCYLNKTFNHFNINIIKTEIDNFIKQHKFFFIKLNYVKGTKIIDSYVINVPWYGKIYK